ncbi:uncharacterized protein LOC124358248 [Homalodisca vitripennis]|uniref:uncharacterized protein LOC124358248 n=1 Tax=Homalodisca vitripennis TaxID=197043 RepID=UPI001EECDA7D|nr:uncharacterized protein LOC124358248 [Homalodisca vitripennis]
MLAIKSIIFVAVAVLVVLSLIGTSLGHGTSYTSVHNKHGGKYEYKIEHSKHGHWSGHAHPHGYGGFGEKHHRR